MPQPDYKYQRAVLVACSGPGPVVETRRGPAGTFASKSHAQLSFAVADVLAWAGRLENPQLLGNPVPYTSVLREATKQQVLDEVADANEQLNMHNHESSGGTLSFLYSGHAYENGDLCLADGPLSPDELADAWTRGTDGRQTRHVGLVLDCCYAGMTLARLVLHPDHGESWILRDAFAACLPSQQAYELTRLAHGVLTYTMVREDPLSFADAIRAQGRDLSGDEVRHVRKLIRESTQYLTNGAQHALDLINGHFVSIPGRPSAGLELLDCTWSLSELADKLDALVDHSSSSNALHGKRGGSVRSDRR